MNVLDGMRAFRAVVTAGSFAAAARSLGVTTAGVSKRVAQLEAHLGAQLLVRTTRRLSVTDAGRVYFERCAQLLDDLEEAERSVGDLQAAPRGRLRVTAPMSFGLLRLAPLLARFHEEFPDVVLDVVLNDRYVDLIEEGFDVSVRVGATLDDSSLVARKLTSGPRVVCASPTYLTRAGTPKHPRDLARHACLLYSLHASPKKWSFDGPEGSVRVDVGGGLQINNSIALRTAAVAGAGILLAPDFVVAEELESGALRQVLPRHRPSGYTVFAVSPATRFGAPKVRAFTEFLARAFGSSPSPRVGSRRPDDGKESSSPQRRGPARRS